MENQQENIRISELIARECLGVISTEEQIELAAWKNSSASNRDLYNKVKDNIRTRDFTSEAILFDEKSGWNRFSRKAGLVKQAPVIYLRLLRYAAIFILPLLAAWMVYHIVQDRDVVKGVSSLSYITPGESKAVLTMSNGSTWDLETGEAVKLNEDDGTVIVREGNILKYERVAGSEPESGLENILTIPRGGEYIVILSDGTRVHLNSMTTLRYPVNFPEGSRVVELTTGEAFFEVAEDKSRPFMVKLDGVEIEVLGTSFNINAYSGESSFFITLEHGSLRVFKEGDKQEDVILIPDQQAEYSVSDGYLSIRDVDASLYSAWREGSFIFRDQRLEDIIETLSRWYSVEVLYQRPELKDIKFSGHLNKYNNVEQILEIFAATKRIKYDIDSVTIKFY